MELYHLTRYDRAENALVEGLRPAMARGRAKRIWLASYIDLWRLHTHLLDIGRIMECDWVLLRCRVAIDAVRRAASGYWLHKGIIAAECITVVSVAAELPPLAFSPLPVIRSKGD